MGTIDIQRMTRTERLQTMELLWDAFVKDADSTPSPEWHESILNSRMEKIRRGEAKFLDINEVKQRLGRPSK